MPYKYIATENWEAFAPVSITADDESKEGEDDQLEPSPRADRTITIRVKGNVNLVIE